VFADLSGQFTSKAVISHLLTLHFAGATTFPSRFAFRVVIWLRSIIFAALQYFIDIVVFC